MLAVIYASIMMLWFWGSRQKDYYFGHKFFSSIKTLPQLIHSMPPVGRDDFQVGGNEEQERLFVAPTKQLVSMACSGHTVMHHAQSWLLDGFKVFDASKRRLFMGALH